MIVLLGGISGDCFPVQLVAGLLPAQGCAADPDALSHPRPRLHRRLHWRDARRARSIRPSRLCAVLDQLGVERAHAVDRRLLWRDDRARARPAFPRPGRAAGGDFGGCPPASRRHRHPRAAAPDRRARPCQRQRGRGAVDRARARHAQLPHPRGIRRKVRGRDRRRRERSAGPTPAPICATAAKRSSSG